jgi:O-antigen/teichoic acid export membrane protein
MFIKAKLSLNKANISVLISTIGQILNSLIAFILIPVLFRYFDANSYGLWVTLISLVSWILSSDFGIGYGFRNKVTEYIADGDKKKFRECLITTFQYYIIVGVLLFLVFLYLLYTNKVLREHKGLALLIYIPNILYFPFSISNPLLQGLRLVHVSSILNVLRSLMWITFVSLLLFFISNGSIYYLAWGYCFINILINCLTVILAFKKANIHFPSISEITSRLKIDKSIIVGFQFFVLQVSSLLLFSMGNYFTYSNLTPNETAKYDIINKVFSAFFAIFNIIISVYWSEIAYYNSIKDYLKLRMVYKNLLMVSILFSTFSFLLIFIVPVFFTMWTHGKIGINGWQCLPFSILIVFQSIAFVGAVFLNAFEKVLPQVILSSLSIFFIYPLVRIGFNYHLGISTIPLVSTVLLLPSIVVCHFFTRRILSHKVFSLS